jgi:hypothetical protein
VKSSAFDQALRDVVGLGLIEKTSGQFRAADHFFE